MYKVNFMPVHIVNNLAPFFAKETRFAPLLVINAVIPTTCMVVNLSIPRGEMI